LGRAISYFRCKTKYLRARRDHTVSLDGVKPIFNGKTSTWSSGKRDESARCIFSYRSDWWRSLDPVSRPAVIVWVLPLSAIIVRTLVRESRQGGIYSIYESAAEAWLAGAEMYTPGDGFLYPPVAAAFFCVFGAPISDGIYFMSIASHWLRTELYIG